MPALNYYLSAYPDDPAMSVRRKTKREVEARLAEMARDGEAAGYESVKRVTVHYDGALDLLCLCLQEGHGAWEL